MKIGLIADIHSNLAALKAVMSDMPRLDQIICAGDLVGYAAEPNEVVELVKSKKVRAVLGNHDHAVVTRDASGLNSRAATAAMWSADNLQRENHEYLTYLPVHLELNVGKWRIYVVHGSPRDPLNEYIFPDSPNSALAETMRDMDADVVVLGHTHVPMKRPIMGKFVINPGAVGQPRDRDPRASYAILTVNKELKIEHRRVEYNIQSTADKIVAAGLPKELATRLLFGW